MKMRNSTVTPCTKSLDDQVADLRQEIHVVSIILVLAAFFLGAGITAVIFGILM